MAKSVIKKLRKASSKFRREYPKMYACFVAQCEYIAEVIRANNNGNYINKA